MGHHADGLPVAGAHHVVGRGPARGQLGGQPDTARAGGQARLDAGGPGGRGEPFADGLGREADDAVGSTAPRRALSARKARATSPLTEADVGRLAVGVGLAAADGDQQGPSPSRASVTSRHSSAAASERRSPPMKSSSAMTRVDGRALGGPLG